MEHAVLELAGFERHHCHFCCVLLSKHKHVLFARLDEAAGVACDLGPIAFHELRPHHRGRLLRVLRHVGVIALSLDIVFRVVCKEGGLVDMTSCIVQIFAPLPGFLIFL